MNQIANLSPAEAQRLQKRLARLEDVVRDFAFEHETAARRVSERLRKQVSRINWDSLADEGLGDEEAHL